MNKWCAFSKKQSKVLTWWCPKSPYRNYNGIVADGSVRSGKTLVMSVSFILWATTNFNNQNFAICGKTIASLRRNVIMQLPNWLEGICDVKEYRGKNYVEITKGNRTNKFFLFGGKDEASASLIQGMTLAGVLFDEVALMPRSFVEQALARCSVEGSTYWFNCNPEGPEHWFKKEWIDKAEEKGILHLHFTMEDNNSLSPKVRKRYEEMFTGVFYDRFIRGLWCVAEGLVYQAFNNNIQNALYRGTQNIDGQYFISIDYGTINPTSMGLWCVRRGEAIRVKEFYYSSKEHGRQKTDEEYYQDLTDLAKGYAINKVIVDPSAASFIACIRRHGRFRVWQADNDVLNGIRVTATLLQSGMVKIHESCKNSIREFGLYRWDEKSPTDSVIKENDHAMDDIRYFCYTILAREFRWIEWR